LADVANESGEAQETDERQEFGEAQNAQCSTSLQDLEALAKVLHPQKLMDQNDTDAQTQTRERERGEL